MFDNNSLTGNLTILILFLDMCKELKSYRTGRLQRKKEIVEAYTTWGINLWFYDSIV